MTAPATPSETPNVVIESPTARKYARTGLDIIGATLGTVIAVDAASTGFDVTWLTVPAMAGWTYLRLVFGIAVDNANTPRA